MNDLIKARGLAKSYGGTTVLDSVDITVPAGTIVGFVGANGAGKTCTIRALLGLMPLDSGSVELFGEPLGAGARDEAIVRAKRRIGVVLDTCPFIGDLTVKAVGDVVKAAYPTWRAYLFEDLLQRFELNPQRKVKDLSRGMGMKLQLACALAHEPELLVLDEATAGLDPLARDEVLDILRAFVTDERHGILLSSHITTDLEKIADVVVGIDGGRILFDLEKDAITDSMGVARCRTADVERIVNAGVAEQGTLRILRHEHSTDVLVPDRFSLAHQLPDIACDPCSIEDYLQLVLKGEPR